MFAAVRMSVDSATRRLRVLRGALQRQTSQFISIRLSSSEAGEKVVNIGDVTIKIKPPRNPELVPVKYGNEKPSQSLLSHLRWIMQKDVLGQDVFLIGPPGPMRRNVAMMYLEMTQKEAEYISLSRDTTETDLKQRREIKSGTAYHIDQCAVKAATHGRVLVLEGIEKAERNVLPVLNNLLENREMQLEDGRFLMAAERYDKLLMDHTQEELDSWKIIRVDEGFRVIALGLPVPRYRGNPLDPPLRSRFQARDIVASPFKDQLELMNAMGSGASPDTLAQMLSFASTMKSDEASSLGLPDFPLDNLTSLAQILNAVPNISPQRLLERVYPFDVMLNKEGQTSVIDALRSFELLEEGPVMSNSIVTEVRKSGEQATVELQVNRRHHSLPVKAGTVEPGMTAMDSFVSTGYHDQLLAEMMQSHMVKDFCIIGPRGCGKSVLSRQFADMLGYRTETIMLYQDMTARDLLQQRMTMPNGDTTWRPSPLVTAALEGSLAVVDGVHRVNPGTFAVLHRLIHDRELSLFDGTRLLRDDRYDAIKEENNLTDQDMQERDLLRIHPSFRILSLTEPPEVGSSSKQWLNPELLTMFLYHIMRQLTPEEEMQVLNKLVPEHPNLRPILEVTQKLRQATDSNLRSVSSSLSTRQLLRIARRMATYPSDNIYETIEKACLSRFLPRLTKTALEEELESLGVSHKDKTPSDVDGIDRAITCEVTDGILRIGNTQTSVYNPENKMKVPDILFYENPQHLAVMEDMLKDFLLGEHLLLVGNQGVGKNKIVDRFLQMLNRPREYLQLHRDTTVQTLTLQPTVLDGVILYEDSPLVKAVKNGNILVVDEADKAPTNVTCILKTLVEAGEMHLADGRRIVSATSGIPPSANIIVAHPDFRMIVLANRPGFPFLGNDFFGAMGDIFSCFAVDNPDTESELAMLRQYGPSVPEPILRKLVLAFSDLRDMADQGLITYPYSTREVVNMVKHLEMFPKEGLASVVRNVFDFDTYNKELSETVIEALHKHGIPVGADPRNVSLAKELELPRFQLAGEWQLTRFGGQRQSGGFMCPVEDRRLRVKGPVNIYVQSYPLERTEARSVLFTEQEAFWTLPLHETCVIADVAVTKGGSRQPGKINDDIIHIATANPISLYTMNTKGQNITYLDLYDFFPTNRMGYRPRVHLAPLAYPLDQIVVLHEEMFNIVLSINYETGEVNRLDTAGVIQAAADKLTRNFRQQQGTFKMCSDFGQEPDGILLFYKQEGDTIDVIHMLEGRSYSISLPFRVNKISMASRFDWLISDFDNNKRYFLQSSAEAPLDFMLKEIDESPDHAGFLSGELSLVTTDKLNDALLSAAIGEQITSPNRVLSAADCYATLAVGMPELSSIELYHSPREETSSSLQDNYQNILSNVKGRTRSRDPIVYLPQSGQVVRAVRSSDAPKDSLPKDVKPKHLSGYLEITDVVNKKLRYLPVPGVINTSSYSQWYSSSSDVNLVIAGMSNDSLVTVDDGGCVRLWETAVYFLQQSIENWRGLIGEGNTKPLQVTYDREFGKQAEMGAPKHGQVDPTGNPHVGGSNFAGGTGGMGTAGLGGMGGPYRLDGGNDVFQVAQWEKDGVPEDVLRAARDMAQKAWRERLKQIKMSEYDGEMYDQFHNGVKHQIKSLRVILDSLQAKGKERQWLKHQTHGDLDEAKLIEGLTGERAIYRRRGEKEPEMGMPQQKPKLVRLLCDVSGSMYRFNGYDGRLNREMEAMLMVMEALEGYEQKIKFEIVGHSGEGYKFDMLKADKPPKNNKERLEIIKTLHAHAQFCMSGDHTLEATEHAIKSIVDEEADEHFVIVLSDANLERYGIRPKKFADVLTANEDVNSYVIFIGSLGDQATRLMKQMPSGRAFMCMDTKNLPQILQQIFTSTMLSTR